MKVDIIFVYLVYAIPHVTSTDTVLADLAFLFYFLFAGGISNRRYISADVDFFPPGILLYVLS